MNIAYEYSRDPKEISDDNTAYTVGLESTSNGTQHESSLGPGLALMPNDALLDPADTTLPDIMYVTLAENNHSDLGDAPISLHIIKIEKDNRYRGEIDILYPDNAFDEKSTSATQPILAPMAMISYLNGGTEKTMAMINHRQMPQNQVFGVFFLMKAATMAWA
ncbi:MAG: hypothetical protein OMM_02091 [Candidatus Magnetoglobus multicellularis str. Araruama]|uniref:Uncharacterized protein n=1 Tax=Candidatus Magnetoglobus multicellularis str. Araruama TaxID=890399 RepID=A0A1V1PAS1_9BACT|nr:MAG: hypothetical protein OMM_02091 [Candidatus Magnetoglobus multicellularis str. Araruama]